MADHPECQNGEMAVYCWQIKNYQRCSKCWPCACCEPCADCEEPKCPYKEDKMAGTKLTILEETENCCVDLVFTVECSNCHQEWQCDRDDLKNCPYCAEPFVGREWLAE